MSGHTYVRWCDHLSLPWRTGKPIVGVETEVKSHLNICEGLCNFTNFKVSTGDNDVMRLKIKESLLIKKDEHNLNKNVYSTPLYLFWLTICYLFILVIFWMFISSYFLSLCNMYLNIRSLFAYLFVVWLLPYTCLVVSCSVIYTYVHILIILCYILYCEIMSFYFRIISIIDYCKHS